MADIGGMAAMLIDTPGVRETDDLIEREAITVGGEKIREADLVIVMLDATTAPAKEPGITERRIVAINKTDRPAGWDFSGVDGIRISAKTGLGCDELCGAVHARLGVGSLDIDRARWWTERQRGILESGPVGMF